MPDSVSVYEAVDNGRDFVLVDLNPAAERTDDIARDEVVGKCATNLFPDVCEIGLLDVFRRVWTSGEAETFPMQLDRKGGMIRWCESYISKLPDTGRIAVIYGNIRDFRGLVDGLFAFISIYTTSGHLVYANQAPLLAVNLKQSDVIGELFWETYWWSHSQAARDKVRHTLEKAAKGEVTRGEFEVRVGENKTIIVDASFGPLRDANGNITRLCGFGVDISGQKQAEESARETQSRLAEIFQIAPEAVISLDPEMNIQDFNYAAERVFGYASAEILGQPLNMLMPQRFHEAHDRQVETFANSSEASRLMDTRQDIVGRRKDGSEFPAAASVSKIEIGGRRMFTVMLHDITEQKLAREALLSAKAEAEMANRAKTVFLAAMGHELRTPLNAIIGFSEIMKNEAFGSVGSSKYREYTGDIRDSGHHLLRLINDILDFSRIESGSDEVQEDEIRIRDIISTAVDQVKESAEKKGIILKTEIPDQLPKLLADEGKVVRILVNLLSNAIKFSDAGQEVVIKAQCEPDSGHMIEIIDTGIGIAQEHISKALTRFDQVDSDLNRQYEGTGLGLPLTKAFVNLHGGNMDLTSELGVGTTVTVQFPPNRTVE